MLYQERLVDLLDRKYKHLIELPISDFLVELAQFVDFVLVQENLVGYVKHFQYELERHTEEYESAVEDTIDRLIGLNENVSESFSELESSLKSDSTAGGITPEPVHNLDVFELPYKVQTLVNELDRQIKKLRFSNDNIDDPNLIQFNQSLHEIVGVFRRTHYTFVARRLTLPGYAFEQLNRIVDVVKGNPPSYRSLSSLLSDWEIDPLYNESVLGQSSDGVSRKSNTDDRKDQETRLAERARVLMRRFYEGIRSAIGSHLMYDVLLQRYKARCMWYDQERIEELIAGNEGRFEDVLSHDLALYLFDNGISTLYRARKGKHEYDLIGDRSKARLFIEVKVYSNSARSRLIQGFAQLHAYVNGLETDHVPIREVYYVIYRLKGPLYDLPWEIRTNRHTFYPVVIDIGPSSESGSRQSSSPISISSSDFFAGMGTTESSF